MTSSERGSIAWPILFFILHLYWVLWFVVDVMGYPLIPATTTNDYWELVTINVETGFWTVVFFIPGMILACFTMLLIKLNLRLAGDLYADIKGVFARDE